MKYFTEKKIFSTDQKLYHIYPEQRDNILKFLCPPNWWSENLIFLSFSDTIASSKYSAVRTEWTLWLVLCDTDLNIGLLWKDFDTGDRYSSDFSKNKNWISLSGLRRENGR